MYGPYRGALDPASERGGDALMAEANAENRHPPGEVLHGRHRYARRLGCPGAGRDDHRIGSDRVELVERTVITDDDRVRAEGPKGLCEVVDERIEVVDQE